MIKKVIIVIIIFVITAAAAIFIFRYRLIQYSADKILRSYLPDYVRVDRINFDAQSGKVTLNGFKILNPPDFSSAYLMDIREVSCRYKMKGKTLIDGFEIMDPIFKKARLNIERLGDGRVNLQEMQAVLNKGSSKKAPSSEKSGAANTKPGTGMKPSDFIKLPEKFLLEDGSIIFTDKFRLSGAHVLTFENVDAQIFLKFDDRYSMVLKLSSTGEGHVNGQTSQLVKWDISMDPTAPGLTMSNRFDVSGVEIKPFEPYYDRYSPLTFESGIFSGTLIFDFNNGSIGSTNEIHLKDFRYYIKKGYENAQFWDTTVPDLVKYFSSPYGEIVFDFKIKGDMQSPQFYLGPISKQALASMAVDKISSALESMSKSGAQQGGAKNDLQKAKDYIDLFKGMMNKK